MFVVKPGCETCASRDRSSTGSPGYQMSLWPRYKGGVRFILLHLKGSIFVSGVISVANQMANVLETFL